MTETATADAAIKLTAERASKTKHRITAEHDGNVLHMDTVNVSSAAARQKFLDAVTAKYPGIDRDDLDAELVGIAAAKSEPQRPNTAEAPDFLDGVPDDILVEAHAALGDPDLLEIVGDALAAVGVAGERSLAATIYLIGTSRLLPRPLAGIIRGSSSSGKSYTVEKVASLFPPEAIIRATQMTPQALFHMPPGSLKHKWVVAGERSRLEDDDRAEATRALREMISAGRLDKLMPVKGGSGIETQVIEQEGPIAFTETTTLTNVFEEDANRCLLLQTDENPEQTRRIILELARRQTSPRTTADRTVLVQHTIQRLLPAVDVRVPWADRVAESFDCTRVEVRRAFPQLLALVQASALLHHQQREWDDGGAVLADANDYHLARRLILRPFSQSLGGGLSDPAVSFLGKLRGVGSGNFTAKGVAKDLKVSKASAAGWINELHDAGAVELVEQGRGRVPSRWRLTGTEPDPADTILPTVEKVFPEYAGRVDAKQIA